MPSFELASQGHRTGADGEAVPTRLEADVDVETPVSRGLGIPGHAQLGQQVPHADGGLPDLVERGPRLGVEVDAKLVGMSGVLYPVRPQVKTEAPQVDGPENVGDVGDDQCVRGGAVGSGDHCGLQPARSAVRHPLLEEGLPSGTSREPLEKGRPADSGTVQGVTDLQVVRHQLELGRTQFGKVDLVRTGDLDGPTRYLHGSDLLGRHQGATGPSAKRRRPGSPAASSPGNRRRADRRPRHGPTTAPSRPRSPGEP